MDRNSLLKGFMKKIKELFYPTAPATERQRKSSQRLLLIQGALAATISTLGAGNFMAGYLTLLGATPAQIAQIAVIPQLGCVLQLFTPLLFERLRRRKLAVVSLCFLYRFLIGFTALAPLLFREQQLQLNYVFVLYLIAFLAAGFVTPALNQWIMQIAPQQGRGSYFARKDIIAAIANAAVAFLMGLQLDGFSAMGKPMAGYLVVYGFCMLASVLDMLMMSGQWEEPSPATPNYRLKDWLAPFRDRHFRPLMVYEVVGVCSYMVTTGFLSVYQLNVLGLSHTFITSVGIVSSAVTMAAIWFWGKVADRTYWTTVVLATRAINVVCMLGWWLMPASMAPIGAPVLMTLYAAGTGSASMAGVNLQYAHCPPEGKTAYLGITMAVGSLAGYAVALVAGRVQLLLEPVIGMASSMAAMLGFSGFLSFMALLYGWKHLPRQDMTKE